MRVATFYDLPGIPPSFADAVIGAVSVTPRVIVTNTSSPITIAIGIPDPSLIPDSVNLLRIHAADQNADIAAALRDDGQGSDKFAGDKTFTTRLTVNELSGSQVRLRVSAAFRNSPQRITLDLPVVFVQSSDVPQQMLNSIAKLLEAGM